MGRVTGAPGGPGRERLRGDLGIRGITSKCLLTHEYAKEEGAGRWQIPVETCAESRLPRVWIPEIQLKKRHLGLDAKQGGVLSVHPFVALGENSRRIDAPNSGQVTPSPLSFSQDSMVDCPPCVKPIFDRVNKRGYDQLAAETYRERAEDRSSFVYTVGRTSCSRTRPANSLMVATLPPPRSHGQRAK